MRITKRKYSVYSSQQSGKYKYPVVSRQYSAKKKKLPSTVYRLPSTNYRLPTTGFTLIELMAVIAIIMILSAIIIPNVVKNVERGRVAKATADIDVLVKAVNLFQIDHGRLPEDLSELWTDTDYGPYIASEKAAKTPWGGSYELVKEDGSYTITATGGREEVSKTITFESTSDTGEDTE